MKDKIYLIGILITASLLVFTFIGDFGGELTGLIIGNPESKTVLGPTSAGRFYPEDPYTLRLILENHLKEAIPPETPMPRGFLLPHGDYQYSGITAAHGFRLIMDEDYETIIIIAPSTNYLFEGAAIPNASHYRTPLGEISISEKADKITDGIDIFRTNRVFEPEHTVEVQIPFLQIVLSGFEIIPIITSRIDPEFLAEKILEIIDDKTLVIAASDLSHYYSYDEAVLLDSYCTDSIPNLDFETFQENCYANGVAPVLTLMNIASEKNWNGSLLDYRNSGDTMGAKESVVGYASIAFYTSL